MKPEIIVAIDTPSLHTAMQIIDEVPAVMFKVGLEVIYSGNLDQVINYIYSKGERVFFDAKLSDIPTTVEKATRQICSRYRPQYLTVRNNASIAIPISIGYNTIIAEVPKLTTEVVGEIDYIESNAVVCSPYMAKQYRELPTTRVIICPGIRLTDDSSHDHIRYDGIPRDADYIVVGRPITQAKDMFAAYEKYEKAIKNG